MMSDTSSADDAAAAAATATAAAATDGCCEGAVVGADVGIGCGGFSMTWYVSRIANMTTAMQPIASSSRPQRAHEPSVGLGGGGAAPPPPAPSSGALSCLSPAFFTPRPGGQKAV